MRTLKALLMCSILVSLAATSVAQLTGTPSVIIGGLPAGATYPQVVSSNPVNGSRNVSTALRQITITFDQPMNVTTFYWPTPTQVNFPQVTNTPYWTNGNKTIVLPVSLSLGVTYQIPLNVYDQAFKSAQGVPLPSGMISFTTGSTGSSIGAGAPGGGYAVGGTSGTPGTVGGFSAGTQQYGTSSGSSVSPNTKPGGFNTGAGGGAKLNAGPTPVGGITSGGILTPKPLGGAMKKKPTPTPHP